MTRIIFLLITAFLITACESEVDRCIKSRKAADELFYKKEGLSGQSLKDKMIQVDYEARVACYQLLSNKQK